MSYKFSKRSKLYLSEAHPDLQALFNEVIKVIDCKVIEGYRTKEEQNRLFDAGKSKLKWPRSKHNQLPALAVDVVPCPIDWSDTARFYHFVGIVRGLAWAMDIPIRCGADWNGNNIFSDQSFHDLPHFELLEEPPWS